MKARSRVTLFVVTGFSLFIIGCDSAPSGGSNDTAPSGISPNIEACMLAKYEAMQSRGESHLYNANDAEWDCKNPVPALHL